MMKAETEIMAQLMKLPYVKIDLNILGANEIIIQGDIEGKKTYLFQHLILLL